MPLIDIDIDAIIDYAITLLFYAFDTCH